MYKSVWVLDKDVAELDEDVENPILGVLFAFSLVRDYLWEYYQGLVCLQVLPPSSPSANLTIPPNLSIETV